MILLVHPHIKPPTSVKALALALLSMLVLAAPALGLSQTTTPTALSQRNSSEVVMPNPMASTQPASAQPAPIQPAPIQPYPIQPPPTSQEPTAGQPSVSPTTPAQALPPLPVTPSQAFDKVVDDHLGVTPDQIVSLHKELSARQKAASEWPYPPKTVNTSVTVSLSPGSTPPLIRPFYGLTTTFLVVDRTGQPWPVENAHNGNPGLFAIDRLDGPQGASFTIDALQPYGQSDLILKLAGQPTPVVITLVAGQKIADARVELRVDARGPNAMQPVVTGSLPPGTDARLLPVLDGVAPQGSATLKVEGADNVQAWMLPDGKMLVRAPFRLLSPFRAATSSADGTTVYELSPTPRLLGLSNGSYVHLTVSGW